MSIARGYFIYHSWRWREKKLKEPRDPTWLMIIIFLVFVIVFITQIPAAIAMVL